MLQTFPIDLSNFHERVKNGLPKSNNAVEGFNSALNNDITNSHPSIWKLIDGLKVMDSKARKNKSSMIEEMIYTKRKFIETPQKSSSINLRGMNLAGQLKTKLFL